jgi:glycosyltransferase involved in cell wall biosynthesis
MPGLFIQRQAEALTRYCDVAVIYVHPDPHCPNKREVDFSVENEVRVLRAYFKSNDKPSSGIGKALILWRYYRMYRRAFHSIRDFSPDLVHAHILTRTGLIGWKLAVKWHIPLVISEHWSRYFPENNSYHGWLRKQLTRFVVKRAAAVVAVSEPLRNTMRKHGLDNPNFMIVPNVVNTSPQINLPAKQTADVKIMVHISCFDDKSKNISGFLRSVKALSLLRQDFNCILVGDGPDWHDMKEFAGYLRIADSFVRFTGLKTCKEVEEILAAADFSVLSSRYETFGTVVIESLACGVPVVATNVGIAGTVIDNTNGLLVIPEDEQGMTTALNHMLDKCGEYDRISIKNAITDKYSKETIGNQLLSIYRKLTKVSAGTLRR